MFIDFIKKTPLEQIKNPPYLGTVNIITIIVTFIFSLYGVYEAFKEPNVLSYTIQSPKVKEKTRVVMLSDLHIDVDDKPNSVTKLVDKVNLRIME